MERPKCPKCGSTNLYGWAEHISTFYYRTDKNGDFNIEKESPVMTFIDGYNGISGYKCKDCGCMWNSLSGKILN